ncbi:MAG: hypothetical protein M1816_002502 [Peltula sp. TS41687]|nr:MAG: hypothetical protein M1816_002502 [Peltula sp. TS41687]
MWNVHGGFSGAAHPHASMGGATTGRMTSKPPTWQRSPLPPAWFEQPPPTLPTVHPFHALHNPPIGHSSLRTETLRSESDDDLIPTAIVIKNIPFAVKKEQLVQLMADLHLPLPYAFNYHFDHGVFRGLAFANFTTPDETAIVIEHLNHFELQGRKLRVEYKKMLPLQERERIEREKRERRGQLEEQHRPMPASQLHNQHSMSSLSSHIPATSPSPVSARNPKLDVDLNNPQTLQFYSQLLLFKDDNSREALIFPSNLSPTQRRTVHTLAHHMSLAHVSRGNGEHRQVHVFRAPQTGSNISPPIPQYPIHIHPGDAHRRGLNRAATIDFGEARGTDMGGYGTLGRQPSGLLDIPGSPGIGGMSVAAQNLRGAKSYADLRSYTPSPVPSTASFPALTANISRYADGAHVTGPSGLSNLTQAPPSSNRDENLLMNGLAGMSLGAGLGIGGSSSRDPRGMLPPYERDHQPQPLVAPIGSNRTLSLSHDDPARERGPAVPARQPRGPLPERGPGFPPRNRPNGHQQRGSDESSIPIQSVEIVVE